MSALPALACGLVLLALAAAATLRRASRDAAFAELCGFAPHHSVTAQLPGLAVHLAAALGAAVLGTVLTLAAVAVGG
jgi:hypothetical protein